MFASGSFNVPNVEHSKLELPTYRKEITVVENSWKVYFNKKFSNLSNLVELENSLLKISRRQTKTNSICNSEFWTFKNGACRWLIITYQPYLQKKNKFSHGIRVKGNEGKGLPLHMDSIWYDPSNHVPHWFFAPNSGYSLLICCGLLFK